MTTDPPLLSKLMAEARRLLGLTGPPGAGKSTLAARIVERLAPAAVLVPMDGFHLANAELRRLRRVKRTYWRATAEGTRAAAARPGVVHALRKGSGLPKLSM